MRKHSVNNWETVAATGLRDVKAQAEVIAVNRYNISGKESRDLGI